jgi:hypothetical protein
VRWLWRMIARRLPPHLAVAISDTVWSLPLAVYRLSGRRIARSPQLYRAGVLRQQLERSRIPGMTTMTERAYFKWHAQEQVKGSGTIVDLGCWLGSTTAAMAMGLSANPNRTAKGTVVHAYDRFVWELPMDYHSPPTRMGPYRPGDSFRPEFELVVRRWRERIVVHEGDLLKESWADGPIELLLVDAMKSWELASHVLRHFYPALLPEDGYLIHQDFSHCFTPWIPLTSYRLLDYLLLVKDIPRSESLVFRLRRPLPPSELNLTRGSFDDSEIAQAFEYWLRVTAQEKHSGLRAARILLLHYDGDAERADRMRSSLCDGGLLSEFHEIPVTASAPGD